MTDLQARVEELEYVLELLMTETEPHQTLDTYAVETWEGEIVAVSESFAKAIDAAAEVLYRDDANEEE